MDCLGHLLHEHAARGIHPAEREHSPYPRKLPVMVLADVDRAGMTLPQRAGHPGPLPSEREGKMPAEGPDVCDVGIAHVDGGIPRSGPDHVARPMEAAMQEIQERGLHDRIAEPGERQHGRLQGRR